MRPRFRPVLLTGMLAAAGLLLSGCTVPRPEVTFFGNRTSVVAEAELWCDVDTAALTVSCPEAPDTSKDAHLALRPDQPLQIDVPGDIGNTPWVVVFEYRDAKGAVQTSRTEVFTDDRLAYTLPSLGAGTQLTRVEVQSGLVPTQDSTGATAITASRTWVLIVTPVVITSTSTP